MNIKDIITESQHACPHCGGPLVEYSDLMEKKDACYYKVKASAKVWPSAYASGRLVQCRKKGASNYGNKSESMAEGSAADGSVNYTLGHTPDAEYVYSIYRDGKKEGTYHSVAQAREIMGNMKLTSPNREYKIKRGARNKMAGPASQLPEQGMTEDDDEVKFFIDSEPAYYAVMDRFGDHIEFRGDDLVAPQRLWGAIQQTAGDAGGAADIAGLEDDRMGTDDEQGVAEVTDPEIEEMYEAMEQLAEEMAATKGVSVDLVWESFEALDDHELFETAAWRRKEGKSAKGGLNAKGVASYRRENPGSKLQMAVTTKPSKLKPGSKAAKRRKSFCARMGGVKGPMKKPNGKPTRKALALRKWNC